MKLNHLYIFKSPNTISSQGIQEIGQIINRVRGEDWLKGRNYLPPLPRDFEYVWVNTDGKFTKRVAKYYYQNYGLKLPDTLVSELGNVAKMHASDGVTYRFRFTDTFDWRAGEYGDYGSCFFGGSRAALQALQDNDALAMQFVDESGKGIARAWIFDATFFWVVWNGYGLVGDPTLIIARTFAQWLGVSYVRIDLDNWGRSDGTLYINGGVGYAVGSDVADETAYDFEWDEPYTCCECGDTMHQDDIYFGVDDGIYCERCYCRYFDSCYRCGESVYQGQLTHIKSENIWVCSHCLQRRYTKCDVCGEHYQGTHECLPASKK